MALKAAMWVHGAAVEVEGPVDEVVRRGTGALITGRPDASTRMCFPIPTPVVLDGRRQRLVRIFVLYDTLPQSGSTDALGPRITSVRVFDGAKPVKSFENLGLTGPHDKGIDSANTWSISPPLEVFFGLALSVGVFFPAAPSEEKLTVLFTAAGADFDTT